MSGIARWAYESRCTFWSLGHDEYGQPTYVLEYTAPCAYQLGGALKAENSIPSAEAEAGMDTFYLEIPDGEAAPAVGWAVVLGTSVVPTPPAGAKRVKQIDVYDVAMFGEAKPDYKVMAQ